MQAALTWVAMRDQILAGGRPHAGNAAQLMALDQQLWNVRHTNVFPLSTLSIARDKNIGMNKLTVRQKGPGSYHRRSGLRAAACVRYRLRPLDRRRSQPVRGAVLDRRAEAGSSWNALARAIIKR